MKMPLWGRTESGTIEPFPYHLLSTLSDGSLGMRFPPDIDRHSRNIAFGKFRSHFEWSPVNYPFQTCIEYRLRHQ